MNILLTGSKTKAGRVFLSALQKRHNVIETNISDGISPLNVDKFRQIFKDFAIDVVIHCEELSSSSLSNKEVERYFELNIIGTRNLVQLSDEFNVGRFILKSTNEIEYSKDAYSLFKLISESHVLNREYGTGICFRLDTLIEYSVGDKLNETSLIDSLLKGKGTILNGNPVRKFNTPEMLVDKIQILVNKKNMESTVSCIDKPIQASLQTVAMLFCKTVKQVKFKEGKLKDFESNGTSLEHNLHILNNCFERLEGNLTNG